MRYEAVLFDFDGTLIDSIPLWLDAYSKAFSEHGIVIDHDDFLRRYYRGDMSIETYLSDLGFEGDHEPVRDLRDELYVTMLKDKVAWVDGAEEVLRTLANKGVPIGIVTGSYRPFVSAADECLNWSKYVDVMITIDDVQGVGKPDPFGIHKACLTLEVDPENAVYFGDLRVDREAAHAAGMPVCMLKSDKGPQDAYIDADHIVSHMSEAMSLLLR